MPCPPHNIVLLLLPDHCCYLISVPAVLRRACCAGVKNAMVVALDDDTKKNAEGFGLPAFRMDLKVGAGGCWWVGAGWGCAGAGGGCWWVGAGGCWWMGAACGWWRYRAERGKGGSSAQLAWLPLHAAHLLPCLSCS